MEFDTHHVQAKELTRVAKQECKSAITLSEGTSRGRLALKSVEAAEQMTEWHDAIVAMLNEEVHIDGLIELLKAKDINLADQDIDAFLDQDTKKVDDGMRRLEKRKEKLLDNLILKFGSSLVINEPKDKDKGGAYSPVCPSHVDRQKGSQLGSMNVVYCKKQIRNTYAIFPWINQMINGYNPVTGVFPEPPNEDNHYKGIPKAMIPRWKQQAQALYDLYEAGSWPKDVLNAVLNPKPAGDTSDSKKTIGGRIGDGVMCLFAGVSLFRPRSVEYKRKLKQAMCGAHNLFRSGNPKTHIEGLEFNLSECLALGVRLPWDETGLPIIMRLSSKGTYQSFLHPYREGGSEPDDSAPYLQELFAEIIRAAAAQGSDVSNSDARSYKAFEVRWNPEEGLSEVTEVADEGDDSVGNYNNNNYYDNADPEGWYANYTNSYTKGKGGFGKGKGKGKGSGKSGKSGKGGMPFNPWTGGKTGSSFGKGSEYKGGRGLKGETSVCAAKGCNSIKNGSYAFCDACHSEAKAKGKLTLKDGREWLSPDEYRRQHAKRAYDTMIYDADAYDGQAPCSDGWYDDQWAWHDSYGHVAHDTCVLPDSVAKEIARQIQLSLNPSTPSPAPSAGVTPSPAASASVQARLDALAGPNKH